jgi:SulP family sulfate permease
VAVLGKIGNTRQYSDTVRHPDNILLPGVVVLRIESSILYFNAENILEKINHHLVSRGPGTRLLVLDLTAAPYVDVAGSKMLLNLVQVLNQENVRVRIIGALSNVREILRKQGLEEITGHISRSRTIDDVVSEFGGQSR